MIKIDVSLLIQIVNFLFLIWILNLVLYKPIRNVLIKRNDKVKGLEQDIETFNRDAGEKDDAYAEGIKTARAKGLEKKGALISAASDEEKKIIEKINRQAQADLAAIRNKITKETEEVRSALQREIDVFANEICQKILGRTVS
jgi:F-type H+-transporting ATPase subunit b